MRFIACCIVLPVALASVPSIAGEAVLYGPPPAWVEVYDAAKIDNAVKAPIVILDAQQLIDKGTVTSFIDMAIRLDSPQALTQAGTSTAAWMPDKGDLTIHSLQILRDGEVIDVLASGAKYSVIQRETQLEQRMLDGSLTATMSVPGLRVGDILRVSYTKTVNDSTLQGKAQLADALIAAPTELGFGRQRILWPSGQNVQWKAGPGDVVVSDKTAGGYRMITMDMPLAKRDDFPEDAPMRFSRSPTIQAGTFSDWKEVSRVFAPLYKTGGTIARGSSLAEEVERIKAASTDPVERAALATRLVQDKISYLLNGFSTGNYTPQIPSETWEKRYGDCKAKTLLLLSILDAMGIKAEPALVHSTASDAIPELLPMPGAFDHVLVKAEIGGKIYWLDGTATGARLANIADTPNFKNFLPIRAAGADLQPLVARIPEEPSDVTDVIIDQRAGVELPSLVTVKMQMSGAQASSIGAVFGQVSEEQKDDLIDSVADNVYSGLTITSGSFSYDEDAAIARLEITGIATTPWKEEGARRRHKLSVLPSASTTFNPDRARPAWRNIPVELGYASLSTYRLTMLLPDGETGFELRGRPNLDLSAGGTRVVREGVIEGEEAKFSERIEVLGGELAAADIAPEKGKAARIANSVPYILAPRDTMQAWQYGKPELRTRLKPYEDAYQMAIARDPQEASGFIKRANFRSETMDFAGAIEDYNKALQLDPDPIYYTGRGNIYVAMGNPKSALADYRQAFELDPSADRAMVLAYIFGELKKSEEALALIEEFDDYGDNHAEFVGVRADVLAKAGRAEEGLAAINELIADRPGQGDLLNDACWYQARFSVGMDSIMDVCNAAVERAGLGADALDSRALAWLQLGETEKAVADADAALALNPGLLQTRYLRAFALRAQGDNSEEEFIKYFARVWPGQADAYSKYGLKP